MIQSKNGKKSLWLVLGALTLAGCEQKQPPTAEGLKKIAARMAKGTTVSKVEVRIQPEQPRAGEVSIWDLKIFKAQDKPDGSREEWQFFSPLPQPSDEADTTEVLMNAWLVSRDGSVFLPARPSYKAYGSFVTDWTPPRPGPYALFLEYHPALGDKQFIEEQAQWNLTVIPGPSPAKPLAKEPHWTQSQNPAPITLHGLADGSPAGTLSFDNLPTASKEEKTVTIKGAPNGTTEMQLAALSDRGTLLHFPAVGTSNQFAVQFPTAGTYRLWAYFSLNGAPYAAPMNQEVSS